MDVARFKEVTCGSVNVEVTCVNKVAKCGSVVKEEEEPKDCPLHLVTVKSEVPQLNNFSPLRAVVSKNNNV